jgi:hypothetical protein
MLIQPEAQGSRFCEAAMGSIRSLTFLARANYSSLCSVRPRSEFSWITPRLQHMVELLIALGIFRDLSPELTWHVLPSRPNRMEWMRIEDTDACIRSIALSLSASSDERVVNQTSASDGSRCAVLAPSATRCTVSEIISGNRPTRQLSRHRSGCRDAGFSVLRHMA